MAVFGHLIGANVLQMADETVFSVLLNVLDEEIVNEHQSIEIAGSIGGSDQQQSRNRLGE